MRASLPFFFGVLWLLGCGDDGTAPMDGGGRDAAAPDARAPGDGGTETSVTLHDLRDMLAWVAAQDGADGAWEVLDDSGGGTYRFEPTGSVYGLVYVCDLPTGSSLQVVHATVAEVSSISVDCAPLPAVTTADITGTVAGLTG